MAVFPSLFLGLGLGAWFTSGHYQERLTDNRVELASLESKNLELGASLARQNAVVDSIAVASKKLSESAAAMQKHAATFSGAQQAAAQAILQTPAPAPGVDRCVAAVAAFNQRYQKAKP